MEELTYFADITEEEEEEDSQLVNELLDDISPFFMVPHEQPTQTNPAIDSGLVSPHTSEIHTPSYARASSDYYNVKYRAGMIQEESSKFSLRIKSWGGNAMADDGYKWRKYGQKSIKNSPHPRSYYRCTNPRCSAKKQVEQSLDDPETLIITYEGLHLHFTYPFFDDHIGRHHHHQQPTDPPVKKQKRPVSVEVRPDHQGPEDDGVVQGGLLEDVVPLMIRKPFVIGGGASSSSASNESQYTSSPASSNSFSAWSPDY